MTQGFPQGGWAPQPTGWQGGPPPGAPQPSRAPVLVAGIAGAVLGLVHVVAGLSVLAGPVVLYRFFPLASLDFLSPLLTMLFGLAAIAGGVLLVTRFGWARFVVAGVGVVAVLDCVGALAMGFAGGPAFVTLPVYMLLWVAVAVVMLLPAVGRAADGRAPGQPVPQGWQPQPQGFPVPGHPQGPVPGQQGFAGPGPQPGQQPMAPGYPQQPPPSQPQQMPPPPPQQWGQQPPR
ncbi:hypothetical protein HUO13_34060 [Saccharopolyspora erythraea]|uniref:hypothetical protein n=1 Tax=Saccharopolyspora erythraea TaxID=1836 RepID=UPI001BA46562|nr:hypothetical protein [Saccharopolyspora erythraea]QUH05135.1 hypothetical protein HUO13_34060 [Saccharopolyspora erythraea]